MLTSCVLRGDIARGHLLVSAASRVLGQDLQFVHATLGLACSNMWFRRFSGSESFGYALHCSTCFF